LKYLCMGYHDETAWAAMGDAQRQTILDETFAYQDVLRESGHFIEGIALQDGRTAATLRFESARPSITDGPFAETKEQLGGVMVLEATDLNQAIQLMSQLPCMRVGGSLEIRPVNETLSS
jgi:hypothetical protein